MNSHRSAEPPLECVRAKTATALAGGEFDVLLAFGSDTFVYLTQSMLPFAAHSDFKVPIHASGQALNGSHSMGHVL